VDVVEAADASDVEHTSPSRRHDLKVAAQAGGHGATRPSMGRRTADQRVGRTSGSTHTPGSPGSGAGVRWVPAVGAGPARVLPGLPGSCGGSPWWATAPVALVVVLPHYGSGRGACARGDRGRDRSPPLGRRLTDADLMWGRPRAAGATRVITSVEWSFRRTELNGGR